MEQIIRHHQAENEDCYFWAVQSGAELDLLIEKEGRKVGFEFKYTSRPALTKSIQTALEDVSLDSITIITPTSDAFPLAPKVNACNLQHYIQAG